MRQLGPRKAITTVYLHGTGHWYLTKNSSLLSEIGSQKMCILRNRFDKWLSALRRDIGITSPIKKKKFLDI